MAKIVPTTGIVKMTDVASAFPLTGSNNLATYLGRHPNLPQSGIILLSSFRGLSQIAPTFNEFVPPVAAGKAVNLATRIINNPNQGTVTYTAANLPAGVTLSATGILSNVSGVASNVENVFVQVTNQWLTTSVLKIPLILQNSSTFPPIGATNSNFTVSGQSYGNGNYSIRASVEYDSTQTGWRAFDRILAPSGYLNMWTTLVRYSTSGTLGLYTGSKTTTIDANTYSGEWLQISLPQPIIINSYAIWPVQVSGALARSPHTFVVAGSSNNGSTWTAIDTTSNLTNWTMDGYYFHVSPFHNTPYNMYRLCVNRINGSSLGYLSVAEFQIYPK